MKTKNKQHILVVDDEKEICQIISHYLEARGFLVSYAYDGEEALEMVHKQTPDLIILDVAMPKKDGFTVLGDLKSEPAFAKIPVIMLTVKSDPRHLDKGISLSADFYLPKPFKLKNLENFINLVLKDQDK